MIEMRHIVGGYIELQLRVSECTVHTTTYRSSLPLLVCLLRLMSMMGTEYKC